MAIPGASLNRSYRISDAMKELTNNTSKSKDGTVSVANATLTVYSPGINQYCYVYLPVFAPRGTIVEVKFEGRQDTKASQGRVMFDRYATRDELSGEGLVDWVELEGTDWKPYTFTYSGDHHKPYAYVRFGFSTSGVGKAHYRNITINVYNVMSPSPDVRLGTIRFEVGKGWFIDDGLGRFSNLGLHSVETKSNQDFILLNYARMQAWGIPAVTAQVQSYGGRYAYHTVTFADMDFTRIYIVRSNTGEFVNPHTLNNTFVIAFTAMAF